VSGRTHPSRFGTPGVRPERLSGVTATTATGARCRVCGGTAQPRLRSMDYNRRLADARFTYYCCGGCGSLSLPEPPADLDRFYPGDYYRMPATRQELAAVAEAERYKLELVQRFVPRGRLLEIGPAVGGFAYLAREAGYEVETVEMDAACCEFLRDVVGVGVTHSADAKAVLQRSPPLQVVALWHVLEHLADPMETLAAAAEALSPGGILVVAAPNPDAIQFSLFGPYWAHLDAPRHLQLIPARHLREQGAGWGLTTVLETATDRGGLGWNLFGWSLSLGNLAGSLGLRFPQLGARAISRLARPVERTGLRGSTYTLILRKAGGG
jgi:SAM-dependent methyltransferase